MPDHVNALPIIWGLGILMICMIPGMLSGMINGIVNLRASLFHEAPETGIEVSPAARNWMMAIGIAVIALGLFTSL